MEEATINQSSTNTQPAKQSENPSKNLNNMTVGFGGIILLVIGFLGGYFVGSNQNKTKPRYTNEITQVSPTSTQANPTSKPTNINIDEWVVKTSTTCNTKLRLPPKETPYFIPENSNTPPTVDDEGSFWIYKEFQNTQSENPLFTDNVWAIFSNPDRSGSGYIAGLVNIECAVNSNNYTTQTLLDKYSDNFTNGTYSGISIVSKDFTTLWNKQVAVVYVKGGMYNQAEPEYLLATPTHIYRVSKTSMSSNSFVKETTEAIFNNLEF